jgi:hypothetical protein
MSLSLRHPRGKRKEERGKGTEGRLAEAAK